MKIIRVDIKECPICNSVLDSEPTEHDYGCKVCIQCSQCGTLLFIAETRFTDLEKIVAYRALKTNKQSLWPSPKAIPLITQDLLQPLVEGYPSFSATDLLNEFLSSLCNDGLIGKVWSLNDVDLAFYSRAKSFEAGVWCQSQARDLGLLSEWHDDSTSAVPSFRFQVSARGWQYFQEIQNSGVGSKRAFMALQFSNSILRTIIYPKLKITCKKAGFELVTVDENRKAGSIDDKIRVDIRNSRFLIVDLSDQNPGAYFEAGFSEGLGKPVFYICDKNVFEKHHDRRGGQKAIHFDIEHHDIISWDVDKPERCADELLASIRNTLPDDAKMFD